MGAFIDLTNKTFGRLTVLNIASNIDEAIKTRLQFELIHYGRDDAPQKHLFEEYSIVN